MKTYKYIPDQSDRDAIKIATVQGIKFVRLTDGTWVWQYGDAGCAGTGFETRYHAARDALVGSVKYEPENMYRICMHEIWHAACRHEREDRASRRWLGRRGELLSLEHMRR